tara:strand:- start:1036 stop:1407 length:372 start_codon:yes stop_codon:yes gene_type:complete
MQLGNFSISLTVKDIHKSKQFYERLGFVVVAGNIDEHWLVLRNASCKIGLFQGMFDQNILTFNPGWDADGHNVDPFTDVRQLQSQLKAEGLAPTKEADENGSGPDFFTLVDPDGNQILVDQHR